MELLLIEAFLPEGILKYFELKQVKVLEDDKTNKSYYVVILEEYNKIYGIENHQDYESKGFTEITLQDFPIRGKAVFLKIRRRRWRHKIEKKQTHRNDFSMAAEGAGFTRELSDFLKGTGRYTRRHDS